MIGDHRRQLASEAEPPFDLGHQHQLAVGSYLAAVERGGDFFCALRLETRTAASYRRSSWMWWARISSKGQRQQPSLTSHQPLTLHPPAYPNGRRE